MQRLARSWIILTEKSSKVLKLKVGLPQKKKIAGISLYFD